MANIGIYRATDSDLRNGPITLRLFFLFFSVLEPDGKVRTVKYTADDHHGFQAQVFVNGQPVEHAAPPQEQHHPVSSDDNGGEETVNGDDNDDEGNSGDDEEGGDDEEY